jgi:DNA polymerase-3 subunit gamma/tau
MDNREQEFIVTARKWRPQRFNDVVGQDHISTTLINAIKNKRLHHAYLFSGPRGVGKTTTARILARAINCSNMNGSEPCNECDSCIQILEGRSLDVIEIDGASNNSVEDIRKLRDNSKYPPALGKYKLYIIDEVHMLSNSAFNALLKTLEEPPPHLMFVFATTEVHKLPPTILSRCQRFEFRRMELDGIINQLKYISEKENITIDEESLITIAKKADGSMRDSQSIFDQVVAFCGNNVKYTEMSDALHLIDEDFYFRVSDAAINNDIEEMFNIVRDVMNKGYDLQECINGILEHFRNILTFNVTNGEKFVNTSSTFLAKYKTTAEYFNKNDIIRIMNILAQAESSIRFAFQPRVKFELTLSQVATLDKTKDINILLNEINELKKKPNLGVLSNQNESNVTIQPKPKVITASPSVQIEKNEPEIKDLQKPKLPDVNNIEKVIKEPIITQVKQFDDNKQISTLELTASWKDFVKTKITSETGLFYLKGSMVEIEFSVGSVILKASNDIAYTNINQRRELLLDLLKSYYNCNVKVILIENEIKEIKREEIRDYADILTADFNKKKKVNENDGFKKKEIILEGRNPTEIEIIKLFKVEELKNK